MKKILLVVVVLIVAVVGFLAIKGASTQSQTRNNNIIVSIYPLKFVVEEILQDESIEVSVLVPPGSSPETFEPTHKQMIDIEQSKALITIGLIDFEVELSSKLQNHIKVYPVSDGINLIAGHCSHSHAHNGSHSHSHGVDPHVWTSPKQLKLIAFNTYNYLKALYPDKDLEANYMQLQRKIEEADSAIALLVNNSHVKSFVIYHPALTYYAEDYGLNQISIENEGKEPSVQHIKNVIDRIGDGRINKILYQSEFSANTVRAISKDTGIEVVEINPLSEDVLNNIIYITKLITNEQAD